MQSLEYDSRGGLLIRARVDQITARRMNAFSVAVTVLDYSMHDEDTPAFYAQINHAHLDEVSLTDIPANPRALVTHETRARCASYDLACCT